MSYDSSNLTTPDIKWLGVRPSDLDRFNIPEQCRLPMTDEDMKTGKRLVGLHAIALRQKPGLLGMPQWHSCMLEPAVSTCAAYDESRASSRSCMLFIKWSCTNVLLMSV